MKLLKRFWKWLCRTRTRTLSLLFAFILGTAFTVSILRISNNGGMVPDSLIYCVFAYLAIVVIMSGVITIQSFRIGDVEVKFSKESDSDDI